MMNAVAYSPAFRTFLADILANTRVVPLVLLEDAHNGRVFSLLSIKPKPPVTLEDRVFRAVLLKSTKGSNEDPKAQRQPQKIGIKIEL